MSRDRRSFFAVLIVFWIGFVGAFGAVLMFWSVVPRSDIRPIFSGLVMAGTSYVLSRAARGPVRKLFKL